MKVVILDTDDENTKLLIKAGGGAVQTWEQVTTTTGEEATGAGETTETITIVRTLLTN